MIQTVRDADDQKYTLDGDIMKELIAVHHADYQERYYTFNRNNAYTDPSGDTYITIDCIYIRDGEVCDTDDYEFEMHSGYYTTQHADIGCRKFYDGDESKNRSILLEWLKGNPLLKEVIEKRQAIIDEYLAARQKEFSPSEVLGDQSVTDTEKQS